MRYGFHVAARSLPQLRSLAISTGIRARQACADWTDAALFASFTPGCLSHILDIKLGSVKLRAEAVVAIASAAPHLASFSLENAEISCHPAVVCATIGGYCEHIHSLNVSDALRHTWGDVQAAEVIGAYRSAVAAARRSDGYRPFTQLSQLCMPMCWCTPPSVWHALLSLMRHASRVECVAKLASNDPLVVCALAHLPSINSLGGDCLWSRSFVKLMERQSEHAGRHHYLACPELAGREEKDCVGDKIDFKLTWWAELAEGERAVALRPHRDFFTAYQRSLSADQQAVLARWAAGDFRPGDGLIRAVESLVETHDEDEEDHQPCSHPHLLHVRYAKGTDADDDVSEERMADVEDGELLSDDDSLQSVDE